MQAATITDEDIDAIIQKGVRSTEELNAKMKDFTENAMKFTMDGGIAYDFKDQEEEEGDQTDYKSLIGASPLVQQYLQPTTLATFHCASLQPLKQSLNASQAKTRSLTLAFWLSIDGTLPWGCNLVTGCGSAQVEWGARFGPTDILQATQHLEGCMVMWSCGSAAPQGCARFG